MERRDVRSDVLSPPQRVHQSARPPRRYTPGRENASTDLVSPHLRRSALRRSGIVGRATRRRSPIRRSKITSTFREAGACFIREYVLTSAPETISVRLSRRGEDTSLKPSFRTAHQYSESLQSPTETDGPLLGMCSSYIVRPHLPPANFSCTETSRSSVNVMTSKGWHSSVVTRLRKANASV